MNYLKIIFDNYSIIDIPIKYIIMYILKHRRKIMFYCTVNKDIDAGNFKNIDQPLISLKKGTKIFTDAITSYINEYSVFEALVDDKFIHIKISDVITPNVLNTDIIPVPWYNSFIKELSTYKMFIVKNNIHYSVKDINDEMNTCFYLGEQLEFYEKAITTLFNNEEGIFETYMGKFIIIDRTNKDYITVSKSYKDKKTYQISNNKNDPIIKTSDFDTDVPKLRDYNVFKKLLNESFYTKLISFNFTVDKHIITNTIVNSKRKEIYVNVTEREGLNDPTIM